MTPIVTTDLRKTIEELEEFICEYSNESADGAFHIVLFKRVRQDYNLEMYRSEKMKTRIALSDEHNEWMVSKLIERLFTPMCEYPYPIKSVVDTVLMTDFSSVRLNIRWGSVISADFLGGDVLP